MKLSEKLIQQFRNELLKFDRCWFKEIYQIKTVTDGVGGNIMFSCRFKTPSYKTYILSINIDISSDNPHARASIHELCDRRWFSKCIAHKKEIVNDTETLRVLVNNNKVKEYYKLHKHFPYRFMAAAFINNGLKDFIIESVDILESINE